MKFSQILEKGHGAILIEEWCKNRLVASHTSHGYGDYDVDTDDGKIDNSNYYFLHYSGNGENPTQIEINQEVEINGDLVGVTDEDGNRIQLRFYMGKSIDFSLDV